MYELIQITENDYYVNCPAKIGIVKICEGEVVLIDSGNDKDAGKKVLRILESNGLTNLYEQGKIGFEIVENQMLWKKV